MSLKADVVLDASALVFALTDKSGAADGLRERLPGMRCHAPHLIDAEVGNVLRRQEVAGLIDSREAGAALAAGAALIEHRYPVVGALRDAAWALRGSMTFYDALYAGLASLLGATLLTADERLSRAPGLPCRVEVV